MRSVIMNSYKFSNKLSSQFFRQGCLFSQKTVFPFRVVNGFQNLSSSSDIVLPNDIFTQTLKGVNFEDYKECFGNKSTWEIVRAISVLKMCSVEAISDNSLQLLRCAKTLMGVRGLRALFKSTLYDQFLGGENTEELRACTRKLSQAGMRAILAATMEEDVGEGGSEMIYNNNCQRILDAIDIVTSEDIKSPMIQLKLSGLLSANLLVKIGNLYDKSSNKLFLIKALAQGMSQNKLKDAIFDDVLDDKEKTSLERALQRFKKIGMKAKEKEVKVLVDAECTYMNPGLSFLTIGAMSVFNYDQSVIWNTYQCYLKSAEQLIIEEMDFVKKLGCHFGAKLVRGAYMIQERNRAKELRIQDPIFENYLATCDNYNKILSYLLDTHSRMGPQCQFIVASHNVNSIKYAVKRMEDLNISRDTSSVSFGQLYGMCDQVSNPLMKVGLPVYKSIAYGRIDEVLPYLARRAVENKSVLEGTRNEVHLLKKELRRRIGGKLYLKQQ